MRLLPFVLALSSAACLRQTEFHCSSNTDCGAGGFCEAAGSVSFCAVADSGCPSGEKFGNSAGSLSNTCVGGGSGSDGGIDMLVHMDAIDAPPDEMTMAGCPTGFAAIANGTATHEYKLITTPTDTWSKQATACHVAGYNTYLAIPSDQGELDAIDTFANGSVNAIWIGISDQTTGMTYTTVNGSTLPAFTPTNGWTKDMAKNCVSNDTGNVSYADTNCGTHEAAVCECEE
jgi:hypothetical protein